MALAHRLHSVVLRAAAGFRRHPGDDLVGVHDVARLAVYAVGGVDLQPLATGPVGHDLVDLRGTEPDARVAVLGSADRRADLGVRPAGARADPRGAPCRSSARWSACRRSAAGRPRPRAGGRAARDRCRDTTPRVRIRVWPAWPTRSWTHRPPVRSDRPANAAPGSRPYANAWCTLRTGYSSARIGPVVDGPPVARQRRGRRVARAHGVVGGVGGQHAAAHRQVDALEPHRVQEPGGVAGDQGAVHERRRDRVPPALGQRLRAVANHPPVREQLRRRRDAA